MPELKYGLSVGDEVGNYRILGIAGAGGMGVVYRALDRKLERTVALKFLPAELNASEKEKERFLKEARTASSLDHPNVGVIHGVEEASDGRSFIVMAFYEGESLAQKIRGGPIPFREATEIAMQMAQGLAAAHARNIVHRDVKPSNVMLTQHGLAKIVDFGLARVVSSASMTQTGGTSGTVGYMSPEQTLGKTVDQRTDIWALGVVLAEMITGQRPFRGDSAPAVMFAILNQPPAPMEGVPLELQKVIYRALSKDPASRYASCEEMLADLEAARANARPSSQRAPVDDAAPTRSLTSKELQKYVEQASSSAWAAGAPRRRGWQTWLLAIAMLLVVLAGLSLVPPIRQLINDRFFGGGEKHIAVLPFDNIGNDPANAALADGLMESLTSQLSNLDVGKQSLWVVPASVVRSRKISDPSLALKELGANLVVKGSIQRMGSDIHLTVDLIDARNLRQIGSSALEDRTGDLGALQDEAVARLARLMSIKVTAEMLRATGGKATPAAYESYLKALGYMQRYDKQGNLDLAIQALNGAVQSDPQFALGFAELGEAYRLKYQLEQNPKWIDEASANSEKAVALDDRLPVVYVTLARLHNTMGKHDLAVQEFQHALTLNPRDADALSGMARSYETAGRTAEAETTYKKAAALRPDFWDGYNELGNFYNRQGKYAEAIAQYRRAIELTPDNAQVYTNLGGTYINTGDPKLFADAEQALKKSIELGPSYPAYANLGNLYAIEKHYPEAAAMTEKALQLNDKNYLVWNNLVVAYEWLKEEDKADGARERMRGLLEQTVKIKPQDAIVQSQLAWLYAHQKLREKAVTRIQTALALAPDDPDVLANVGSAYEVIGDRRHALEYVSRALQKGYALDQLKNDPELQDLIADPNFQPNGK